MGRVAGVGLQLLPVVQGLAVLQVLVILLLLVRVVLIRVVITVPITKLLTILGLMGRLNHGFLDKITFLRKIIP